MLATGILLFRRTPIRAC